MMDQYDIAGWADTTFGPASSNARIAARANEEMAELLRALTQDDNSQQARSEIADVVIVLCRLATNLGCDIDEEVVRKMKTNRNRKWKVGTDGHGYHIPEVKP